MIGDLLPPAPMLGAFFAASLVLAVTPGPAVMYIVTRSLAQGRSAGLASVAGAALGNLANAIGASIGLAALFAVSAAAFTMVKLAGAGYLIWLGLRALRAPAARPAGVAHVRVDRRRVFSDGFLVALLNPKTAMFFAAFLPQFMVADAGSPAQSIALGVCFVAVAATTDTVYALAAGAIAPVIGAGRVRAAGRYLTGGAFIGLGVFTALSGSRSK